MCFSHTMSAKLDIFKWGKRRQLSSDMDARFGDLSISAPNEGSWNEMARMRPVNTGGADANKVSRFKTLFRSKPAESSDQFAAGEPPVAVGLRGAQAYVPHHPMVDMQVHQRSLSVDRGIRPDERRVADERLRVSTNLARSHTLDSPSSCDCDGDDEGEDEDGSPVQSRRVTRNLPRRSQSQDSSQYHTGAARRDSRQHRSPPLASTAVMRRYSSQSTATSTFTTSTPSTATFSSKHTSMTSAASHALHGPSIPPLLQEEIPPVPKVPLPAPSSPSLSGSSSTRNIFRGKSRVKSGPKRSTAATIGPQELVPSYDELWGY